MAFIFKKISPNPPTTTTTSTTTTTTTTAGPYNPTIEIVLNTSGETANSAYKEFDVVFTPPIPVGSTVTVDLEGFNKVSELGIPVGTASATSYIEIIKNNSTYYDVLNTGQIGSNVIQTTTWSTAANALGGSPQISNGQTLSFRQEVTAELGSTGTAIGEGEVTVPSATVAPLGTATIIPSIPTQEIDQYINTTVTI